MDNDILLTTTTTSDSRATKTPTHWYPSKNEFVAASLGGMALVATGHPIDTIKIRMQMEQGYKNSFDCVQKTIKNESIWALYKGMGAPMWTISLVNAIFFTTYNKTLQWSTQWLEPQQQQVAKHAFSVHVCSGIMTGAVMSLVEGPVDLIKCNMQLSHAKTSANTFTVAKDIVQRFGARSLFHGFTATLLRNVPGTIVYFASYDYLSRTADSQVWGAMLAGGTAGVLSWLVSYPVDVIKTHVQTDFATRKYRGTWDCTRQLYKEFGMSKFWAGVGPCLLRSAIANAACFVVYEQVHKQLKQ